MPKTVKLADIAQRAGVSTVTVSKALSGQKGVSEEMREKIRQLSDEMGYVKTDASNKPKGRTSYTFGIAAAQRYVAENQSFYWRLYQEISRRAMRKNCFTILEVIEPGDEHELHMPKMAVEEKIEAMIILGTFKPEYTRFLHHNLRMPHILLDTLANETECDAVVCNNMMGGYQMTNHLFDLGHKKIGFVGTRLATASIDDRFFGYLKSAMEHGMEVRPEWLIDDRDRETGQSNYDIHYLLPEQNMPTAFFCNNDMAANIMIRKLTENGYSVPGDVSVAGFDNYLDDPFPKIGITTYAINMEEMAKKSVRILLRKLENPDYRTGVYMVDGRFIKRESTGKAGPPIPYI